MRDDWRMCASELRECTKYAFGLAQPQHVDHGTGLTYHENIGPSYRKPGGSRPCEYESLSFFIFWESDKPTSGGGGIRDTLKVRYILCDGRAHY